VTIGSGNCLNFLKVLLSEDFFDLPSNLLLVCAFSTPLLPRFFSHVVPAMGIKRDNAPVLQVRQLVPNEDLSELAGSRALPPTPQRQRGLWSFLTWPFVIAPIVAAESFFVGNGNALTSEDQDDRAADHAKGQPDAAIDHGQAVAGAAQTPDDSQDDKTDTLRLLGAAPKALHNGDLPHEEHAKVPVAHESVATASPAGDGGGGGGADATSSGDTNASPDSDIPISGSSNGSSGTPFGGIPTEMSHQIVIGESPSQIIIGETGSGGLSIDVTIGGESGLAHTATDVVSTLTGSVADILAPIGLSSSVDLKDLLGFDLHVNPNGEFIATDLGTALDQSPSYAIANTVSSVVSHVADGLPMLNFGTSNALDSLFGVDNHSVVGHVSDLTSIISNDDIDSDDATSALKGSLTSNGTASLEKLADVLLATSPDGSSNMLLPAAGGVPASAPVSIVGEGTAVTPGHSIDFPAPVLPESDVLFRGNSYTDYHVALQTMGPIAGSNSIATTLTSVASTPDTTSLTHVDSPAPNPSAASSATPTVQHQDTSLIHITTTLDDLSLRSHTH
jgi:hypothetical protein